MSEFDENFKVVIFNAIWTVWTSSRKVNADSGRGQKQLEDPDLMCCVVMAVYGDETNVEL